MGQGPRLSTTGAGQDKQWPARVLHGTALLIVEVEHQFELYPVAAWRRSGRGRTQPGRFWLLSERKAPKGDGMAGIDPQLQDHAVGIEMEIVELARQADQAALEGWPVEETRLRAELDKLYAELASVADRLSGDAAGESSGFEMAAEPAGPLPD